MMIYNLHSTDNEHQHNSELLTTWQLELVDGRNRQQQNPDIQQNVHGGVGEPKSLLVETAALDARVPEIRNRVADEERAENGP